MQEKRNNQEKQNELLKEFFMTAIKIVEIEPYYYNASGEYKFNSEFARFRNLIFTDKRIMNKINELRVKENKKIFKMWGE